MPHTVHEIELDESIYGKVKITLRRKDGTIVKVFTPKWNQREEVFKQLVRKWWEEKEKQIQGEKNEYTNR